LAVILHRIVIPALRRWTYLDEVAAFAEAQIGTRQEGPGRYGAAVCALISDAPGVSCDRYEAWCQRFAWVCAETPAETWGMRTTYPHAWGGVVRAWHESGLVGLERIERGKGRPSPGWVYLRVRDAARRDAALRGGAAPGHCGVVVGVRDDGFWSVDGNTNSSGSATGGEVGRNFTRWTDPRLLGWVRPGLAQRGRHA
jgi:hypothetical protein